MFLRVISLKIKSELYGQTKNKVSKLMSMKLVFATSPWESQ